MGDTTLSDLRMSIDEIDRRLVVLLAERFAVTEKVGRLKKNQNLPTRDLEREAKQIAKIKKVADENGLDPQVAKDFFELIVLHVVKRHEEIKRG
jgi:chorismate mutase